MIKRRTLLALIGLAPAASAVAALPHARTADVAIGSNVGEAMLPDEPGPFAVGHSLLQWQEMPAAQFYQVTVKNRSTGQISFYTVTTCQLRFVTHPLHVYRIDVKALGWDGVSRNAGITSWDFIEGDPLRDA